MTQPQASRLPGDGARALQLEYPMSVATFEKYADAQRAVDYLADRRFAVENLAIVGTDLRQYERVMGRRTWGSVLVQGALSGVSTGLLVALMLYFLRMSPDFLSALLIGVLMGVVLGVAFAGLGYLLSRGSRDFDSITQTYAKSYEVLAEHKVAQQARNLLATMPGGPVVSYAPAPEVPVVQPYVEPQAATQGYGDQVPAAQSYESQSYGLQPHGQGGSSVDPRPDEVPATAQPAAGAPGSAKIV